MARRADAQLAGFRVSQILGSTPSGEWVGRQKRVRHLQTQHSHVGEILTFYEALLSHQDKVFREAVRSRSFDVAVTYGQFQGRSVYLSLGRLPLRSREQAFTAFVKGLPSSATELLQAIAMRLLDAPTQAGRLLTAAVSGQSIDEVATELECDRLALGFFPKAFLQPIAEALVRRVTHEVPLDVGVQTHCPYCGSLPQVAVLQDDADTRGKRTLICSLCASAWSFARSCCPQCGEEEADQLHYHQTEAWPHLRVEECHACHRYIKAVDLRINGLAVPLVDELASVELDLWAREQKMVKLQKNVLGL